MSQYVAFPFHLVLACSCFLEPFHCPFLFYPAFFFNQLMLPLYQVGYVSA